MRSQNIDTASMVRLKKTVTCTKISQKWWTWEIKLGMQKKIVHWHRVSQSKHRPYRGRQLAGLPLECKFSRHWCDSTRERRVRSPNLLLSRQIPHIWGDLMPKNSLYRHLTSEVIWYQWIVYTDTSHLRWSDAKEQFIHTPHIWGDLMPKNSLYRQTPHIWGDLMPKNSLYRHLRHLISEVIWCQWTVYTDTSHLRWSDVKEQFIQTPHIWGNWMPKNSLYRHLTSELIWCQRTVYTDTSHLR